MDYNIIAKSYNGLYKEEQLEKLRIIKDYIKIKNNYKLLDIGCGTAISTNFFKCSTFGLDNSFNMLKQGRGDLVNGSAENLPFKDKAFDIILCVTSIHNFGNPKKAINEIKRVKKDKSQVVITLLKKSKNYNRIKAIIKKKLNITKETDSKKDTIFISLS